MRRESERRAKLFYQESGVGNLLSELRSLIQEGSGATISEYSAGHYLPIHPDRADPDSVAFRMKWDYKHLGPGRHSEKFIAVEV